LITVPSGSINIGTGNTNVQINAFQIDKYEVTQCLWEAVMGSLPSLDYGKGDNFPVYYVSWNRIVGSNTDGATIAYTEKGISYYTNGFCAKLSALVGCGKQFRLPTEVEWEYAAKGGPYTQGYTYSGSNNIEAVAWYTNNSGSTSHEVGGKAANELGIYDMSGNLYEFCSDWWDDAYPADPVDPANNPTGLATGQWRVQRGGSWVSSANLCLIPGWRSKQLPTNVMSTWGFRLVLTP
jgi:formylglycine-generating enzyme required for sulfatase activity